MPILRLVATVLLFLPLLLPAATCDNEAVVNAVKMKLPDDIIVKTITAQPAGTCTFNVSLTAIASLQQAGVPEKVIRAMLAKAGNATASGTAASPTPENHSQTRQELGGTQLGPMDVMLIAGSQRIALAVEQAGAGNYGFWELRRPRLRPGLPKQTITLPGPSSKIVVATQPITIVCSAAYPDPPALVRIKKAEKDRRIVLYQKGMEIDRDEVAVDVQRDGNELRLVPRESLRPGQYALVRGFAMWSFDLTESASSPAAERP